jgi:hypothetical protein
MYYRIWTGTLLAALDSPACLQAGLSYSTGTSLHVKGSGRDPTAMLFEAQWAKTDLHG